MSVSLSQATSPISGLINGSGSGVACPACATVHATAQQAAACLCHRRRYITTLGIRLGKVPTAPQLKALNRQSAAGVTTWFNSRLRAAQQNTTAAPAAHQLVALQHLQIAIPASAVLADQALIAWFKSSASTNAAVWALAQVVSASQQPQLALF